MPRYQPPHYIDNRRSDAPTLDNIFQYSLANVLKRTIFEQEQERLWIVSGYFTPNVWLLCKEFLINLKEFKFLLGTEPIVEKKSEIIDLRSYFKVDMRKEIESLTFNEKNAQMVIELIDFLEKEWVEVRILKSPFLHAKAYLLDNYGIVGSSNFTYNGLTRNSELNLVKWDKPAIKDLEAWFFKFWDHKNVQPYKQDLIDILNESKFGSKEYSPFTVFIKVLYEFFKDRIGPMPPAYQMGITLAPFQQEGLQEALRILERHNGVVISDAVGLGKTYIGMGLIEHYIIGRRRRGYIPKGLVICPAQLRNTMWMPKLEEYGIKARILSQEEVSRKDFDWREFLNYDLILMDESHNFRNPSTNRFQNLMKLIVTGNPNMRVILMTATPINNTIWDLYHQLSLITKQSKEYYLSSGIQDLEKYFKKVDEGGAELTDLLEECMVRRSRLDIKKRIEIGTPVEIPGIGVVEFPERKLKSVHYNLTDTYSGFYAKIAAVIERLKLACYNIDQYRKARTKDTEIIINRNNALIAMLKTLYLKRLESSIQSLQVSIKRQMDFQKKFLEILKKNKLLRSKEYRKLIKLEQEEEKENLIEDVIGSLDEVDIKNYEISEIENHINEDITNLGDLLGLIDKILKGKPEENDKKLVAVKNELVKIKGYKVLIFSYFEETARYLYEQFISNESWLKEMGNPRIALLSGSTASKQRNKIVQRFAIRSNLKEIENEVTEKFLALDLNIRNEIKDSIIGKLEKNKASKEIKQFPKNELNIIENYLMLKDEEIDILISTDVLSEGQNLQDAKFLLNYDLHWNPVRMIQRAGRIDRIGSPFKELVIYNCFPEEGLNDLLGLVDRLQKRIRDIDRAIGLDASVLGEAVHPKSFDELKRIKAQDNKILDELEQQVFELVSMEEMKFPLMEFIHNLSESILKEIPLGIHSGFVSKFPGIFFAFRAADRHFWRFYPEGEEKPITNKLKIFRMIKCKDITSRFVPEHKIFRKLEKAIHDLHKDIRQLQKIRRLKRRMEGINKKIYNIINATNLEIDPSIKEKFNKVLENYILKPFARDLNTILKGYPKKKPLDQLISDIDDYFEENMIYREIGPLSVLDEIKISHIELIGYLIISKNENK
ncbi:MAG: helicase [Candidatus Helarchaeota archaeon]|nr:helicase [Candidatus Helarchaeota archaeon]